MESSSFTGFTGRCGEPSSFIGNNGVIGACPYVWYTRCKSPWERATEEQIAAVTNYLTTHQEEQSVGVFKDVRYKDETIYTVYMQGDTIVELLYDDPNHVAYINRLTT
jgi:hypothetical protein